MSFLAYYNQGIKYDIFKLTFLLLFDRNEQKTCVCIWPLSLYINNTNTKGART